MEHNLQTSSHLLLALPENAQNRGLIDALQREGFSVTSVVRSEEVVRQISEDSDIRILIIDSNLPGVNGYETVRFLRSNGYSELIIILLVWFNMQSMAAANLVGCDELIAKPLNIAGLVETAKQRVMEKEQPSPIKE